MDYKEKLRLAKEALDSGSYDKETIEYIFPELKENDDTRVKNKLIEFFKGYYPDKEWWGNITQGNILAWLEEHDEQKSWSKEDEMQLDAAIHLVSSTGHIETANWLKDLKNKVQPQQKWSEEDEMMIKFTLTYFRTRGALEDSDIIKWLKSLKEKIQSQPKHEWSEEDKIIRNTLIKLIESLYSYGSGIYDLDKNQFLDWLQKLENRIVSK